MKNWLLISILVLVPAVGFSVVAPPSVTVQPLTNLRSTAVVFNASVNPNGASTTVRILWSLSPTSFSDSAGTVPGSQTSQLTGNSPVSVTREIPTSSGGGTAPLLPNTTYYYAFGAKNSGGYTRSAVQSFTTNSLSEPALLTVKPEDITQTSVVLNWSPPAEKVRLVYSTGSMPASATSGTLAYEGTASQATVTGLTAGTLYYFKIYAKADNISPTAVYSSAGTEHLVMTAPVSGDPVVTIDAGHSGSLSFGGSLTTVNFTSTGSTTGTLSVTYTQATPVNGLDLPSTGMSLSGPVSLNTIAPVSWTFTPSGLTEISYSVDLDLSGVTGIQNVSRLVVVKRESESDPWTSPVDGITVTLSSPVSGVLRVSGLTSFSQFGLASDQSENSLPVELAGYSVSRVNDRIQLSWETVTESANAGFRVEKTEIRESESLDINACCSDPGPLTLQSSWEKVGFVTGAGTSTEARSYSFTDRVIPGLWIYRLMQVDLDGKETEAGLQGVYVPLPSELILDGNYPNPFNPETQVRFSLPVSGKAEWVVTDLLGRVVSKGTTGFLSAGSHTLRMGDGSWAAGTYFYSLSFNHQVKSGKMLLLK
ncbi:MAG: T9SS type A sorting domain-containing protein [Bacteroidetes bacterium]|nr:T9SS type A sorting domain-containing protein [Bacteroidota bacterium]